MEKAKRKTNAKSKVFPAVAMLLVSALLLSTASYAWFTMNKKVSVTGIDVMATVPETLEITLGEIKDNATQVPSEIDSKLWTNEDLFTRIYNSNGQKLTPSSTVDGISFFKTEKVSDSQTGILKAAELKEGTFKEGAAMEFTAGVDKLEATATGDYLEFPLWIRSRGGQQDINLAMNVILTDKNTKSETLSKALRVALVDKNGAVASGQNIWSANTKKNLGYTNFTKADNDVISNVAVKAIGTDPTVVFDVMKESQFIVTPATDDIGDDNEIAAGSKATQIAKIPKPAGNDGYGEAQKFTVRIWFEGQDENCIDAYAGQNFSIQLDFHKMADPTN